MAITDSTSVKTLLGITDSSQDTLISQVVTAADAAVKAYLRRGRGALAFTNWPETGADTEYYDGDATPSIILRWWPVTAIASLYLDMGGYYGKATGAFAASTELTEGTDWVGVYEDGAESESARIVRIGGRNSGDTGGQYGWFPGLGGGAWHANGPITLSAGQVATWPRGHGNIKITYTAGYSTVPKDLVHATDMYAIWLYNTRERGRAVSSESLGSYSYSLMSDASGFPELGSIRQILAQYRDVVV